MRWFIGVGIALVAVFSLLFILGESAGITQASFVVDRLEAVRHSPGGTLAVGALIAVLLTADLVLPVPSSVLMTLSGFFLGWVAGALVAFAGAMGSAVLGFGFCRVFGQPMFRRLSGAGETDRIRSWLERYGAWAIVLSRSVPMLTETMSCLAGLSVLPWRRFLAWSTLGTAPICVVYAWAGARARDPAGIGWAVLLAFVVPGVGFALVRAAERRKSGLPSCL